MNRDQIAAVIKEVLDDLNCTSTSHSTETIVDTILQRLEGAADDSPPAEPGHDVADGTPPAI